MNRPGSGAMNPTAGPACQFRREVDAYFAGRASPARLALLRPHLADCPICRARFAAQLQLAELDPARLPFEERVARAAGLRTPGWLGLGGARAGALAGVASLAVVLLLLVRPAVGPGPEAGFRPRGAGPSEALVLSLGDPATEVLAFRTDGQAGGGQLLEGRLPATAELAFAYRNGGGWQRLMVFARDELGHVYWYQPPWTDGRDDPQAVPLATSPSSSSAPPALASGLPELHELPQAVSHTIRGRRLELCALATNQALSVRRVEQALQASTDGMLSGASILPGEILTCRQLEVIP